MPGRPRGRRHTGGFCGRRRAQQPLMCSNGHIGPAATIGAPGIRQRLLAHCKLAAATQSGSVCNNRQPWLPHGGHDTGAIMEIARSLSARMQNVDSHRAACQTPRPPREKTCSRSPAGHSLPMRLGLQRDAPAPAARSAHPRRRPAQSCAPVAAQGEGTPCQRQKLPRSSPEFCVASFL